MGLEMSTQWKNQLGLYAMAHIRVNIVLRPTQIAVLQPRQCVFGIGRMYNGTF